MNSSRLPSARLVVQRMLASAIDRCLPNLASLNALPAGPFAFVIALALRELDEWMWHVPRHSGADRARAWDWLSACVQSCPSVVALDAQVRALWMTDLPCRRSPSMPWMIAQHLDDFMRVATEQPGLLPLLATSTAFARGPAAAQAIKRQLRAFGLSKRGWCRLVGWMDDPMLSSLVAAGLFSSTDHRELVGVMRVLQHAGDLLGGSEGNAPAGELLNLLRTLDPAFPLQVRAAVRALMIETVPLEDLLEDLPAFGKRTAMQRSDRWIRGAATWSAVVQRARRADNHQWDVPFRRMRVGRVLANALHDRREIKAEGDELGHCADSWSDRCAAGSHLIVSLRHLDQAECRATLGLRLIESVGWKVSEYCGPGNERPDPRFAPAIPRIVAVADGWIRRCSRHCAVAQDGEHHRVSGDS